MTTNPVHFARLQELFEKALELNPQNRMLVLAECDDKMLKNDLERVLLAHALDVAGPIDPIANSVSAVIHEIYSDWQ